jgi:hypothetical protein
MSKKRNPANGRAAQSKPGNSMDDEFPKTLNAAVDSAGKVHGSLNELEVVIASLREHLGALVPHLKAAHAVMKAAPPTGTVPAPVIVEEEPAPEPVVAPEEPAPVETDTEPVVEEPAPEPGRQRDAGGRFS